MAGVAEYIGRLKEITGAYRLHYLQSRLRAALRPQRPLFDCVFVVDPAWRGWILEAICREIAERVPGTYQFHYSTAGLPPAKSYFISHQSLVAPVLSSNPCVWKARRAAWFTHPSEIYVSHAQFIYSLNQLHGVLFTCAQFREQLVNEGVVRAQTDVVYGAADPAKFPGHIRGQGVIGLSMAYYPRKNPERLVELVSLLAPRRVLLVGRNWSTYEQFDRLLSQPNFSYVEAPYDEYPRLYGQMDVFVSLAKLEGGPIPLIEAMMCNAVPVASRTGFAPDLIRQGENGFLFDVDAPAETIASLVRLASQSNYDVRSSIAHLSWDRFAEQVLGWLRPGVRT